MEAVIAPLHRYSNPIHVYNLKPCSLHNLGPYPGTLDFNKMMCLHIVEGCRLRFCPLLLFLVFLFSRLNLNASMFQSQAPSCLAHHDSPQTPLQNHKFKYLRWCNFQCGWQALTVTVLWNVWLFSQTIKVCLWIFCYLGWYGHAKVNTPRLVSCLVRWVHCNKWMAWPVCCGSWQRLTWTHNSHGAPWLVSMWVVLGTGAGK